MSDDTAEDVNVRLDAFDDGIFERALCFRNDGVPGWCGDDELRDQAVEIWANDGWVTIDEVCIYSDAIERWELECGDLANTQRPIGMKILGSDT